MRVFNMKSPSIGHHATGHIVEQIEMIKAILDRGYAYESNGSVYFNVRKYNEDHDYGALSGRKIDTSSTTRVRSTGKTRKTIRWILPCGKRPMRRT